MPASRLTDLLRQYHSSFHPVVSFDPAAEDLQALDFTDNNRSLTQAVIGDIELFCHYIKQQLASAGSRFGIGGYGEHRTVYSRSRVFDAGEPGAEPRRLHLGTDIWGPAGTAIYCFMDAIVHSTAFNDQYGDYGATIILQHQLEDVVFYTLYGHLSLRDLEKLQPGDHISKGFELAHFGMPEENGHWPPHLHFQVILDMEGKTGDYPGVCRFSEKEYYLSNCPDPDYILGMNKYLK